MRTARVADTDVPPAAPARQRAQRDRAYWSDLAFGRTIPALVAGVFLLDQGLLLADALRSVAVHGSAGAWQSALNRVLSLAYFGLLLFLYVVRLKPRAGLRRPEVWVVSFAGTFAILSVAYLPGVHHGAGVVVVANLLITVGVAYALWGLLYLRRSFSILPEARRLVTTGPYGLSRNPLYLGEFTASLGVVLPNFGPWQALVLVVFIACQLLRIRWEEQVLARTFPDDYKEYFKSVPRFIPQPWRRSR